MAGAFDAGEQEPAGGESFREVQDFEQLTAGGLELLEAFSQWLHDREARAELRTHDYEGKRRICMCTVVTRWVVYAVTADTMAGAIAGAARVVDEKLREVFAKTQPGTGPLEGSSSVEG